MMMPVTRSRAREAPQLESIPFFELVTIEDDPSDSTQAVALQVADAWVACLPVRFAQHPAAVLMAVPSEAVDAQTLPHAPCGSLAQGEVAASAGRSRCRVSFIPFTSTVYDEEEVCPSEAVESTGARIRAFGSAGVHLPRASEVLDLALSLG